MMAERGVAMPAHAPLPLAPPVDGPVLVKAIATRTEIDEAWTILAPKALFWEGLPPLLLRHEGAPVGEILNLKYSPFGDELVIECRVDDLEAARMPAISVAFTPVAFDLVDRGRAQFHFRVTRARLDECSLTDQPALRSALVTARCPAGPKIEDPRYREVANQIARLRLAMAA